ncbi:MAG: ASKHA domain-containing protein [bacterium]
MNLNLITGESFEIKEGESVFDTLKRNEQYLIASCGGKGTCGKCSVRVLHGTIDTKTSGKLTEKDRQSNLVLACQTFQKSDVTIEIPQVARLTVGDKIAIHRSRDLFELLTSMGARISPLVHRRKLILRPPTIEDHVSDLERLKRAIDLKKIRLTFTRDFVADLARLVRDTNWEMILCYEPIERRAVAIKPFELYEDKYGIAVDIGTTTIVVNLIDLSDGRIIDVGSTYNSQMRYGDDVITRIIHATEANGMRDLKNAVLSDINNLTAIILERHAIEPIKVESCSIAGNTVMSHLFWGLDPQHIREAPYIPTVNFFPLWSGHDGGIKINRNAPVYTVPCVASYVGGDIVAGVLASKMHRDPEITLFMDIGTNGEIVVGNNEWLMTAACSAGPCFEGSGIRCGMRATKGAIESIQFDPMTLEPSFGIVGNAKPLGICGSGMIDAIAGMYLNGIIDQRGKFAVDRKSPRIKEGPEGFEYAFYRDEDREVVLSEVDIENILRAKAAIYAGVSLLIKEVGLDLSAIERVYIAGGFGNYLNVRKGIILGMLPDLPEEKFRYLGNTSIAGAYLTLISAAMRTEAEEIASKMTYIELSVSGRFMDEYMSAMFLPHTDISLFPTVHQLLK